MRGEVLVRVGLLGTVLACATPGVAHALEYDRAYPFGTQAAGVAIGIDRAAGNVYVAEPFIGVVERFDPAGDRLDPATFGGGAYGGVAVDQASRQIHLFDLAPGGSPSIATFDSAGVPATPPSFAVTANPLPALDFNQIAVGSDGTIYYPNASTDSVERFAPDGTPQGEIGSGGALVDPSSVAVDSSGDVYVVDGVVNGGGVCGEASSPCDDVSGGRVQKFPQAGGPPLTVQDGNASSVAVDPVTDEVLVGDGLGSAFEVVVYDESGNELTRFGSGRFGGEGLFPGSNNEIAVSETRRVYATDPGSLEVEMFDVLAEAVTGGAQAVDADSATLRGTVNPNGNALFGCRFEYGTTTGYEHSVPCATTPDSGTGPVDVSADVSGLQSGTTYHFRIAATNVAGTSAGADRTLVTAPGPSPPAGSPQPPVPPPASPPPATPPTVPASPAPGVARVARSARMKGGRAMLRLSCRGATGGTCRGTLKLTARRSVGRGKRGKSRNVVIGRASVRIAVGRTRTVSVPISRAGRRLLAKAPRGLRVRVTAPGAKPRAVNLASAPRSTKRGRGRA
jgi:hypothetical protein